MCKLFLPQHTERRVEHGSEAEGDYTDRKGEPRRKRLRFELQTEAFPPGGRFMRVHKVQQFVRLKKVRKLQDPQSPLPKLLRQ